MATLDSATGSSSLSKSMGSIMTATQLFSDVGIYKGVIVATKHIKKEHMQLTRKVLLEFNEVSGVSVLSSRLGLDIHFESCIHSNAIIIQSNANIYNIIDLYFVQLDMILKFC